MHLLEIFKAQDLLDHPQPDTLTSLENLLTAQQLDQ